MRRGTSRNNWNRYEQSQDYLVRACFNEQAAEAAARKTAVAKAAASAG
jgi:hypothetical protein